MFLFFCPQVVQPLGNTTFEIVFLARLVGNVENTLFIHTSKGVYPYQVFMSTLFRVQSYAGVIMHRKSSAAKQLVVLTRCLMFLIITINNYYLMVIMFV